MAGDYFADPSTKRDRYEAIRTDLWRERSSFDSHWKEIADFIQPRRQRFYSSDQNRGDKRNQNIIDSTAKFAARTLSSGLHAGLTSPARPWFKLTTPDPDLAKHGPVKQWLHDVTARMQVIFGTTNIYNTLPIVYGDMGLFGTGCMSLMEDSEDLFRCQAYPIGTYAVGLDERGLATTLVRVYRMTVRQVIQQFAVLENGMIDWSVVSATVKNLWDKGSYEAGLDVVHIVMPNESRNRAKLQAKYKPFSSCYFESSTEATDRKFLRESGFNEFPYMVPRWDVTDGDSYGTDSPGMTALGDVKQLQIMQKRKGQAIAKMVDPPLQGPPSLRSQKTSLLPGDITYVDVREGMLGLKSIHDVTLRIDHLTADIGEVQYRIQRAFYEDLFLMIARTDQAQPATAREIEERHEEKLLALGPVLERTNDELLNRIIDRVFFMMLRSELLPDIPDELRGVKLEVEYISIMAQAQKLVGVVSLDRFLNSTISMAQTYPSVTDKININAAVDVYADMYGVPPAIVRSTEEAQGIAAAREQQAQAQAQAEQLALEAKAIKDTSQAPMGQGTALDRMMAGVQNAVQGDAPVAGTA